MKPGKNSSNSFRALVFVCSAPSSASHGPLFKVDSALFFLRMLPYRNINMIGCVIFMLSLSFSYFLISDRFPFLNPKLAMSSNEDDSFPVFKKVS